MKNILICVCMIIGIAFASFAGAVDDQLHSPAWWRFVNNIKPKKSAKVYFMFDYKKWPQAKDYRMERMKRYAKFHQKYIKNDATLEMIFSSYETHNSHAEVLALAKRVGAKFPIGEGFGPYAEFDGFAVYKDDGTIIDKGHDFFDGELFKFLKSDLQRKTIDGIVWEYRAYKGEACIFGCYNVDKCDLPIEATEIAVPVALGSAKVVTLCSFAFDRCSQTTKISLPGTVRYLPREIFKPCKALTAVHFPSRKKHPKLQENELLNDSCPLFDEDQKVVIHMPANMASKLKKFAGKEVVYDLISL